MAGSPAVPAGHPVSQQIRLTTTVTVKISQVARRGPPLPESMCARAFGPNPSRAKA